MSDATRSRASRRGFLLGLGGAAGLAALPVPRGGAVAIDPDRYDAIVIGGGFAGVTAARELRHAGLRTLLLEARNRLGGRTFTARVGDHAFDLGGMWIHSTQPHVWAEVTRYGLPLAETPGATPDRVLWWNGREAREAGLAEVLPLLAAALCSSGPAPDVPRATLEALALMDAVMKRFHEGAAEAFPQPFDPFASDGWKRFDAVSVRERIDALGLEPDRRALLEGALGGSCNGALAECGLADMLRWWALSGHDLQRYNDSVARYKLRDGTVSLLEAMLADGRPDVLLGAPVRRIEQDGGEVRVTTETGRRFAARAAIAALPMNVLANVEFAPALDPVKIAASRERHAGAGIKVYARVRGELPRFVAFAPEPEPFSTLLTAEQDTQGGVVIGFGQDPKRIDVHSAAAVQTALRKFLPAVEVTETIAYDWHLDPYSLGTWCILRPGQMKALAKLREPEGLVHFAGGDVALGWRGFIDGAIESGLRVGREVAARLGAGAATAAAATSAAAPASLAARSDLPRPSGAAACGVCHSTASGAPDAVGPNLSGVVGRDVASRSGYAYSEALRARDGVWSEGELDAFLADPAGFAPGTKMAFGGVADPAERAALIEWLTKLR